MFLEGETRWSSLDVIKEKLLAELAERERDEGKKRNPTTSLFYINKSRLSLNLYPRTDRKKWSQIELEGPGLYVLPLTFVSGSR